MSDGSVNLNWELLHKADKQQKKLQERVKEALKEQDPEEYRRRFPEEFAGDQGENAPAHENLVETVILIQPERIEWDNRIERNAGFTIAHSLMLVMAVLIGIPVATIAIMIGTIAPAAFLFMAGIVLAYIAGRLQRKAGEKP